MADEGRVEPILTELHERGLRLAIDDFGTGHSSLSRLSQMMVTTLKIDRSFVHDLPADHSATVLVSAIIQLARKLGLQPLAEGIETEEQRASSWPRAARSARASSSRRRCRRPRSPRSCAPARAAPPEPVPGMAPPVSRMWPIGHRGWPQGAMTRGGWMSRIVDCAICAWRARSEVDHGRRCAGYAARSAMTRAAHQPSPPGCPDGTPGPSCSATRASGMGIRRGRLRCSVLAGDRRPRSGRTAAHAASTSRPSRQLHTRARRSSRRRSSARSRRTTPAPRASRSGRVGGGRARRERPRHDVVARERHWLTSSGETVAAASCVTAAVG